MIDGPRGAPGFSESALASATIGLLARCRFPPPSEPLTCAVSGGADSLALLFLARAHGHAVTAVHVDHGLRPGSSEEAGTVQRWAEACGAAFRAERVAVALGANLEARARAARYSVLPADVCTGHTADDQAETMLLHLLRGSGVDGQAAMARPGARRRPVLDLRRGETRELCARLGVRPLDDPMNADRHFARVRVRTELIVLLADIAGRDPVPILNRQAALFADDAAALDAAAAGIDPSDTVALREALPGLARRAVRRWLREAGYAAGYPAGAAVVERVLAVARGEAVGADLTDGWRVTRRHQRLVLWPPVARRSSPQAPDMAPAPVLARVPVPDWPLPLPHQPARPPRPPTV